MSKVKTKDNLPIASGSNQIENFIMWLRTGVRDIGYGKVGLELTVHNDQVVRVEKTMIESCKAADK